MPIKPINPIKPIILGLVLLFTACGGPQQQAATTDTVTDDYGRTVVIPAHPQRVVSLSPAVTEIIYALGADSLLVGRTDFCEYPAEALQIPTVGGISNLNIEKILSLNPDLVISGSMVGKKATDQMDQMGTPMVCVIEKPRFEAPGGQGKGGRQPSGKFEVESGKIIGRHFTFNFQLSTFNLLLCRRLRSHGQFHRRG